MLPNIPIVRMKILLCDHRYEYTNSSSFLSILDSAVSFDGSGYMKYLYWTNEEEQNFQLSLQVKTFDAEGMLMTTNASDWATLEVLHYILWFLYKL